MSRHQKGGRYTPPKRPRYGIGRAPDGWRLLSPDPVEARRRLDRLGPLGDQLEAALGDQLGVLRGVMQSDVQFTKAVPTWAGQAIHAWLDGGHRLCPHLRRARGPQPIWLMAWSPAFRCTLCMGIASLEVKGTAEDGTCDQCRQYDGATVWPVAMTVGNLTVIGGLCDTCHHLDEEVAS